MESAWYKIHALYLSAATTLPSALLNLDVLIYMISLFKGLGKESRTDPKRQAVYLGIREQILTLIWPLIHCVINSRNVIDTLGLSVFTFSSSL